MTTQQPEALRLAEELPYGYELARDELRRLHAESQLHLQELRSYRITVENREARIAELEAIRKAACKAYNAWAYADDTFGEVTQAMHALADAINGITQEKQG